MYIKNCVTCFNVSFYMEDNAPSIYEYKPNRRYKLSRSLHVYCAATDLMCGYTVRSLSLGLDDEQHDI